jgi:SAM-dependent methyltransferase
MNSLPFPPIEMMKLVGPTDPAFFDNPGGTLIFPDLAERAYDKVFDFGSGCGRLARQLMQQKRKPSSYRGVDLHAGMVRWCQQNLTTIDPRFEFVHHDVYNPGFNPAPNLPRASDLPAADGWATLVVAWSVFTHTPQPQMEFYIRDVSRILDDEGVIVSTWFFFEKKYFPMMQAFQNTLYINDNDPTNATIFDKEWFEDTLSDAGLHVTKAVPPEIRGFQWVLHLRKKRQGKSVDLPEDKAPFGIERAQLMTIDPTKIGHTA